MNALATAPGVIATPGKYYIGAKEVIPIRYNTIRYKITNDTKRCQKMLFYNGRSNDV